MSEDQDLSTRPALSGRRERARLLGEDGPPTWEGDGAGQPGPGDRPPAVPPRPLAPGQLPRRVPGSAPGGRTPPPGPQVDRQLSAPIGGPTTLTDPAIYKRNGAPGARKEPLRDDDAKKPSEAVNVTDAPVPKLPAADSSDPRHQ